MSNEDKQKKEHSRISLRIGEFQIELEGTYDNIKKLMSKDLFDFTRGLQETAKQLPTSTEVTPEVTTKAPEVTTKAPEVTTKEKTVLPPGKPSITSETLSQSPRVSAIGKTTEKGSPKKIVGRTIFIALLMICIVLVAGLVSVIAIYMPIVSNLESQIAEKDDAISSLNSQVLSLNSQISSLNSQVSALQTSLSESNSSIASLQQAISYYRSIVTLNESMYLFAETFTQNANTSDVIYNDQIQYAGYISVAVESSSNTTYIQMAYYSYGVDYNQTVITGASGTAVFPVLPGEIVVGIGNTEPIENVTATITAIYRF